MLCLSSGFWITHWRHGSVYHRNSTWHNILAASVNKVPVSKGDTLFHLHVSSPCSTSDHIGVLSILLLKLVVNPILKGLFSFQNM